MKINKACDLSSISVLPPPTRERRPNYVPTRHESSIFGRSRMSQPRSQQSQQSFSQGQSSQPGMFSQISQNSLDLNEQRFGSQERESSVKMSCLPPINHTREESQMLITRSSDNLMRKWNSTPDYKYQINEELERRMGIMETSLSRFGMNLNSVQNDIMQVNRGTKEVALEMEIIRQKLIVLENLLQQMNKGQEDIKISLDGGLKSILDQLNQNKHRESLLEISSMLSALPKMIEDCIIKLQNDLCKTFTKGLSAMDCSLKIAHQHCLTATILPPKGISYRTSPQGMPSLKNLTVPPKVQAATQVTKIEMGSWNSVKPSQKTFTNRDSSKWHKQQRVSPSELERQCRVVIESDEEIDGGFSCLLAQKETDMGSYSIEDAEEATQRILRKARRRKRKLCKTIILD